MTRRLWEKVEAGPDRGDALDDLADAFVHIITGGMCSTGSLSGERGYKVVYEDKYSGKKVVGRGKTLDEAERDALKKLD